MHERPERILVRQHFLAHSLGRITPPRPLHQEPVDRLLDRGHGRLERFPVDRPFPEQVPQPKHQATQRQEVRAPDPQPPTPIHQRLKIANQMAPAQLMALGRQCQIGPMPIRPDDPGVSRPQQVAQGGSIPTRRHEKEGRDRRDHGPEPAPLAGFLPARFVDVADRLLLDGRVDGGIGGGQGHAARLLQRHHAAQADRQPKEIRQQAGQVPIAEVVVAVQDSDRGGGTGAKGARGDVGRPGGRDEVATARAADGMILMGGDRRAHDGELPHVLGLHRAGIVAHVRQRVVAGRADRRIMITHKIDLIGVGVGAVVPRMPRLTASFPPARYAHGARWCGWRVGRWGFG